MVTACMGDRIVIVLRMRLSIEYPLCVYKRVKDPVVHVRVRWIMEMQSKTHKKNAFNWTKHDNLRVLSCFVQLKSVLFISCVFWTFFFRTLAVNSVSNFYFILWKYKHTQHAPLRQSNQFHNCGRVTEEEGEDKLNSILLLVCLFQRYRHQTTKTPFSSP